MEDSILKILGTVQWPGTILAIGLILWKAGLLTALANKIAGKTVNESSKESNGRLEKLEDFAFKAEHNHFTDLERVMNSVDRLEDEVVNLRVSIGQINDIRDRLSRVEAKVFNGYK